MTRKTILVVGLLVSAFSPSILVAQTDAAKGRTFAFLVACADYDKTLNPVLFSVPEMTAFRQVLIDTGVSEKNIVFLHDKTTEVRRLAPTRKNITKEFTLLMERLRPKIR